MRKECEDKLPNLTYGEVTDISSRFLLAKLHMDALASQRTKRYVKEALGQLPDGIDGTYAQTLQRKHHESSAIDYRYAMNLLMWVTLARRPLSVSEIEHAVTTSLDVCEVDPDLTVLPSAMDDVDTE